MRAGHASRTAEHNAVFRALEAAGPPRTRVFDDPFAGQLLRGGLALVPKLARVAILRTVISGCIDGRWPGARSSVIARTALIDDLIEAQVHQAAEQVVLLGAGYDTRPYRLPALRNVNVFEVDHPETQRLKRRRVHSLSMPLPMTVRYVPNDFMEDELGSTMAAAGFDLQRKTVIVWEGVSHYLTETAVDATLRWCASAASGSLLVFTYVHEDFLRRPELFVGSSRLRGTLARLGEDISFGILPNELGRYLHARGLELETDVGAADYRRAYLVDGDAIRGHEFYRVATARVTGRRARLVVE